jgi:hypothetical protein
VQNHTQDTDRRPERRMSEATDHENDPDEGALAVLPVANSFPDAPVGSDAPAVRA